VKIISAHGESKAQFQCTTDIRLAVFHIMTEKRRNAMRLIDKDALKSKVQAQEWKRDPAVMLALDWIYMLINEQPTIDAVPVVRCKDCKSFSKRVSVNFCAKTGCACLDDGYCSCGAKMESEGNT
jgi:hypothetical protein